MDIWDTTKLKAARKSANLKAVHVAEELGITPPYLSGIENGNYQPSSQLIAKFSNLYKMPIAYFLAPQSNSETT